jgi:hypothetical protein
MEVGGVNYEGPYQSHHAVECFYRSVISVDVDSQLKACGHSVGHTVDLSWEGVYTCYPAASGGLCWADQTLCHVFAGGMYFSHERRVSTCYSGLDSLY